MRLSQLLSRRFHAPLFPRIVPAAVCLGLLVSAVHLASGCSRRPADQTETVVLYTSVDEPFAREVVAEFEKQTGIRVQLVTDTEAGKTTGLVRKIEAERDNPRADVFWSSELFNTILLADAGLLDEYRPPAEGIPDRYKDPKGRWTAFGTRGRVICYNTERVQEDELPKTWHELVDSKWSGKLAVADPRFGTTTGHVAAMYELWGEQEYVEFLQQLHRTTNGVLMDGNATVARRVGSGEMLIGATDTDDVFARQARDEPIDMVFPDMGDGGTLLIPNSVALVTGAPHPQAARKLIDFLTSATTERMLAQSESANYPVREDLRRELEMETPAETQVSFDAIAKALEPALRLVSEHLLQ